jgi:Ca2+-binding RTX toxin-like protein
MTDLVFGPATVLGGTGNPWLTGVSDLDVIAGPGGPLLYATTGPGGGVVVYQMAPSGALTEIDRYALNGSPAAGVESRLVMTPGDVALVTGVGTTGLWGIGTDAAGELTGRIDLGTSLPRDLSAVTTATLGATDYLFGVRLGSGAISVWDIAPNGRLSAVSLPGGGNPAAGAVLTDIESVTMGGSVFLLATSTGGTAGDALICWRVGADGVPVEVARIDNATGLGIAYPAALTTANAGGDTYAVFVSAGTGTLTVAQVRANGSLTVTDHVMDDMGTRFQGATIVEAITIAGRTYVVVAGADDGITLFELLPGGRLLDRATLADSTGITLDNVAAIALAERGGDLQIMVTSATEPGITRIAVDLGSGLVLTGGSAADTLTGGSGADLVEGEGGNDRLGGGSGNDVLMDGAGMDTLTGGTGRDVFVIAADGQTDTITDFNRFEDRLDLSGWANLRSGSQLTITPTATGAEIRYGSEILILQSMNGRSLSVAMVQNLDIVGPSRLGPGFVPEVVPPMTFQGGSGADSIVASNKADTLYGGGGDDSLRGAFGDDLIQGGDGDDRLSGEDDDDGIDGDAGSDLLWGGAGHDRLRGGAGNDTAYGDGGDDTVEGDAGANLLYGGGGSDTVMGGEEGDHLWGDGENDRLYGAGGNDSAMGGDGNDTLWGGAGSDELRGDNRQDRLYGETGDDRLYGGDGDDRAEGGDDNDSLWGDAGADLIYGGSATDRLWGGEGNDTAWGDDGDDTVHGLDGDDRLYGGNGNDLALGGVGSDSLWGGSGNDEQRGEGGNDSLRGETGNDRLYGGDGDDRCEGGDGNDSLWGDKGRDVLYGGNGADRLSGGADGDTAWGGSGNDEQRGEGGNDSLRGETGNDRLYGGDGDDRCEGGDGNDSLWGDKGRDVLYGGNGADRLSGGAGNDRMTGGGGADRFVFHGGDDVITDFANNRDEIALSRSLWSGARPSVAAIVDAAVVTAAGTRIDLPGGESLLILGLRNPGKLADDIIFV